VVNIAANSHIDRRRGNSAISDTKTNQRFIDAIIKTDHARKQLYEQLVAKGKNKTCINSCMQ